MATVSLLEPEISSAEIRMIFHWKPFAPSCESGKQRRRSRTLNSFHTWRDAESLVSSPRPRACYAVLPRNFCSPMSQILVISMCKIALLSTNFVG